MIIDNNNYQVGNEAMSSVLLLYYHIVLGGGISNDETVFVEERFNPYEFLDAEVKDGYEDEIDELLIRHGAIVFLLCDLNDMISEYDEDFLDQITTQRILSAFEKSLFRIMPEAESILKLVASGYDFDNAKYRDLLDTIYKKYVQRLFDKLASFPNSELNG